MNRRHFIKSVAIGIGALSVPVVVKANPKTDYTLFQAPGLAEAWQTPNGETVIHMASSNEFLYVYTASTVYALNADFEVEFGIDRA